MMSMGARSVIDDHCEQRCLCFPLSFPSSPLLPLPPPPLPLPLSFRTCLTDVETVLPPDCIPNISDATGARVAVNTLKFFLREN